MQNIVISIGSMVAGEWIMNRFFRPKPPPIAPGAHLTAPLPPAPQHPLLAYLEPTMDPATKEECVLLFEQGSPDELTHGALELLKFGFPLGAKILIDRAEQVRQWALEEEAAKGRELTDKETLRKEREVKNLTALEAERDRLAANIAREKERIAVEQYGRQQKLAIEGNVTVPPEMRDLKTQAHVFRAMPGVQDDEIGFTQSVEKDTRPAIDPNDPLPQVAHDTAPAVQLADLGLVSVQRGVASQEEAETIAAYVNGAVHEGPTESSDAAIEGAE